MTRAVDVGEVNGRVFINNSSIGLYPQIVHAREERRERFGWGKWVAMLDALVDVFRRFPLLEVRLTTQEGSAALTTPFVFIGNNRYEMRLFELGTRSCLDRAELSLYVTNRRSRLGIIGLVLRAVVGRLDQARDFTSMSLPELEIQTRRSFLRVAVDGEVFRMQPPLRYRVRQAGLRVLVPASTAGG